MKSNGNNYCVILAGGKGRSEAKERAEEQMRQKQSIREYYHSRASLSRAMARLKGTSGRK